MFEYGDADDLDGAGAAPVAESGGTFRWPAAQHPDREAREEAVARAGRIDLARRESRDVAL